MTQPQESDDIEVIDGRTFRRISVPGQPHVTALVELTDGYDVPDVVADDDPFTLSPGSPYTVAAAQLTETGAVLLDANGRPQSIEDLQRLAAERASMDPRVAELAGIPQDFAAEADAIDRVENPERWVHIGQVTDLGQIATEEQAEQAAAAHQARIAAARAGLETVDVDQTHRLVDQVTMALPVLLNNARAAREAIAALTRLAEGLEVVAVNLQLAARPYTTTEDDQS